MSEQIILALIAALSGGVVLKLVDGWFGQADAASDDLIAFRRELVRENRRLINLLDQRSTALHEVEHLLAESQRQCAEAQERSERLREQVKRLSGET